jgi:hypothetical protein
MRLHFTLTAALCVLCALLNLGTTVQAQIPPTERAVLLATYTSTNGASWTMNAGWNGPAGTECSWFGISCSAGNTNVTGINLAGNNLVGTLPATFNQLTLIEFLKVNGNQLTGSLPALTGLTALRSFEVYGNQLSGAIPSLTGLTALDRFDARNNQLTGSIPSLSGLSALEFFRVNNNQLSGTIPSFAGLTVFADFGASGNSLTGAIPPLASLSALRSFQVSTNQLTGSIPTLAGLINLNTFGATNNQLTGAIPSLSGLTALEFFEVSSNQLTGVLPTLTGLTALRNFRVDVNQLSGSIPSFAGLTALENVQVGNNQLTGTLPPVPSPTNNLLAGQSSICPNPLIMSSDTAWDSATGDTPWYNNCLDTGFFEVSPRTESGNGTFTPADSQLVRPNETQSFVVTPAAGYSVRIDGTCPIGSFSGNIYTTPPITESCIVGFTFLLAPLATANVAVPSLPLWALGLLALVIATLGAVSRRGLFSKRL